MSEYDERNARREDDPIGAYKEARDLGNAPFIGESEAEELDRYLRTVSPGISKCAAEARGVEILDEMAANSARAAFVRELTGLGALDENSAGSVLKAWHDPHEQLKRGPPDRVMLETPVGEAAARREALDELHRACARDAAWRKARPVFSGVLAYFPDALLAVAHCSQVGNDQHNPGEPLHWARGKSTDETDALTRHLIDRARGEVYDTDGVRHLAKAAWRALAALQKEIEREGP